MNYDKIGKFIAKKRKEKNMTQSDIANLLGITDRAVSRWERGVGCPDISFLEPISEILETSVLEILHGEEIKNENKVIVDILKKDNKTINRWKLISLAFINVLLLVFIFLFFTHYIIPKFIINGKTNVNVVISPSMEPTLSVYDIVISERVNIKNINVGDVVIYNKKEYGDIPIIHRVMDVQYLPVNSCVTTSGDDTNSCEYELQKICLVTKGDANVYNDEECVVQEDLVGVMRSHYPNFGRFLLVNNSSSIVFVVFLILGIISIIFIDALQVIYYVRKR